jgi:hypothetical protein
MQKTARGTMLATMAIGMQKQMPATTIQVASAWSRQDRTSTYPHNAAGAPHLVLQRAIRIRAGPLQPTNANSDLGRVMRVWAATSTSFAARAKPAQNA